jgi:hypothetical protein
MYYVFALVDPRDGAAFYIGKCKGPSTEKQAEVGADGGAVSERNSRIRNIRGAGLAVEVRAMKQFEDENLALRHKYRAIHGTPGLTNSANEKRIAAVLVEAERDAYQMGYQEGRRSVATD